MGYGETDIPIPGFDLDRDMFSDVLVLHVTSNATGADFYVRRTVPSDYSCAPREGMLGYGAWNWGRARAYSVSDMSGDGRPDLLFFDPDEMVYVFKRSDQGSDEEIQDQRISIRQGSLL